jgi:hypothetical protein
MNSRQMRWRAMKYTGDHEKCVTKKTGRDHSGDLSIEGKIILK